MNKTSIVLVLAGVVAAMAIVGSFVPARSSQASLLQSIGLQIATTTPKNWTTGMGPLGTSTIQNVTAESIIEAIPGSSIFPINGNGTVLRIGFIGGYQAVISGMTLYTAARPWSPVVSSSIPVTFGGITSPTLNLTASSTLCSQPVTYLNPCIVKLDPLSLNLDPQSDYYFVVHFATSTSNFSLRVAAPQELTTSLPGWYLPGDFTGLTAGQSIPYPANTPGVPWSYLLMSVTTQ